MKRLIDRIKEMDSVVCVGIDPNLAKFPDEITQAKLSLKEQLVFFAKEVVDLTLDIAVCYKPQIAYFEQYGLQGMEAYAEVLRYLREKNAFIISDVKRGDIGSTAEAYARAFLEPGADFESDAITINPYMGDDSNGPFYDLAVAYDKGCFVLVKTSNPSSGQFQNQCIGDKTLYTLVAESIIQRDPEAHHVGAVVGATHVEELEALRMMMPKTLFLIPGYGAQGATADFLTAGFGEDGYRGVVNSSRGILYPYELSDLSWREKIRKAALVMRDELNEVRHAL